MAIVVPSERLMRVYSLVSKILPEGIEARIDSDIFCHQPIGWDYKAPLIKLVNPGSLLHRVVGEICPGYCNMKETGSIELHVADRRIPVSVLAELVNEAGYVRC